MSQIKSRYTLAEAAEYLKRETGTPELSVHDLVTLAAEGKLSVCFPYKGQLGLFKNWQAAPSTDAELAQSILGKAAKTIYFNGILRSLARPTPNNDIADLRSHKRREHTLSPVGVVPVCIFSSDHPIELVVPEGHHWRRVYGAGHPWAGTGITSVIPDADWLIEIESLRALTAPFQSAGSIGPSSNQPQEETPQQRQDRRLEYLLSKGGAMKQEGQSWRTIGPKGLLAQLVRDEKAAGRPMSDKTDVRQDLIAATERRQHGGARSPMTGEHSPKHSGFALETAWGSRRGS